MDPDPGVKCNGFEILGSSIKFTLEDLLLFSFFTYFCLRFGLANAIKDH